MSDILKTINGDYTTTFTLKYKNRPPYAAPNPNHILSYIPGTITQIIVKPGQTIRKGQPLLTFNAMKMSNTYASPRDGVIAKINVEQGQNVPKGAILVEFE